MNYKFDIADSIIKIYYRKHLFINRNTPFYKAVTGWVLLSFSMLLVYTIYASYLDFKFDEGIPDCSKDIKLILLTISFSSSIVSLIVLNWYFKRNDSKKKKRGRTLRALDKFFRKNNIKMSHINYINEVFNSEQNIAKVKLSNYSNSNIFYYIILAFISSLVSFFVKWLPESKEAYLVLIPIITFFSIAAIFYNILVTMPKKIKLLELEEMKKMVNEVFLLRAIESRK